MRRAAWVTGVAWACCHRRAVVCSDCFPSAVPPRQGTPHNGPRARRCVITLSWVRPHRSPTYDHRSFFFPQVQASPFSPSRSQSAFRSFHPSFKLAQRAAPRPSAGSPTLLPTGLVFPLARLDMPLAARATPASQSG